MAQEMSAGVVNIHHSPDNKRQLTIHATEGAKWQCGEWYDLSDEQIRSQLTSVMDSFNSSKGIDQPAAPIIDLTYPLACFNNPALLSLSCLPKTTQFKLRDLPGLRNKGDQTNKKEMEKCRDALCLVAYNMEETDENRRIDLVENILGQIKQMGGGSLSRMLFVLNRIDVFLKDPEPERRRNEHISKVTAEITQILYDELPEHRDELAGLTYSKLSSLPALHAQRIKMDADRIQAAGELEANFKTLIDDEVLDDLPRKISAWKDHDFERISDDVWQNSFAAEFFATLDQHIQVNFPTLVIPSIVQRFQDEVKDAIGEAARTCNVQLNNSEKDFVQICEELYRQNSDLRDFLQDARAALQKPFSCLKGSAENSHLDYGQRMEIFVFDLLDTEIYKFDLHDTEIYKNALTENKLAPLTRWREGLQRSASHVLEGMKKSVLAGKRDFSGTNLGQFPGRLQDQLAAACNDYCKAINKNNESDFDGQLNNFLYELNRVIDEVMAIQSGLENNRIHDAIELLMTKYLDYIRSGIKRIAPDWNFIISDYMLTTLDKPEIKPANLRGKVENHTREERIWWTLWLASRTIEFKKLPSASSLFDDGAKEIDHQLNTLAVPFHNMIINYIDTINVKIAVEQDKILAEFREKIDKAFENNRDSHEKVVQHWQPLKENADQLPVLLEKLVNGWSGI